MSSGYNSLTTVVLAKPTGLDEAISFTEARGGGPDGGHGAADLEGLARRLRNIAAREPLFHYLFPWAIARAKQRYAPGLAAIRAGIPPAASR